MCRVTRPNSETGNERYSCTGLDLPHGLVVLVCDAALRFLAVADAASLGGDSRAFASNVAQAQRILLELMGALDHAVAPDATESLERLYQMLFDRLSEAAAGDSRALTETRLVLTRLRNAWFAAARSASAPIRGGWACLVQPEDFTARAGTMSDER
jgi:flagellin-specific chaperone FliS